MTLELKIGDRVALSQAYQDLLPPSSQPGLAKGTVKALTNNKSLSSHETLADIEWDKPGPSKRLNIKNLVKI